MADSSDRSTLGSAPIPGDAAAGLSAKYEPEYEKLAAEIAKLESVEGRSAVRWSEVAELASGILANKSKDLLVAAWLTVGWYQNDGYRGLADGLGVIRDMLKTHWEGLFPEKKRMRGRQGALNWLSERLAPVLPEGASPGRSDEEPLKAAADALKEIDEFAAANFDGNEPSLMDLVRAVQERLDSVPSPEPEPSSEPEASGSETAAPEAAPAAPPEREIDSPDAAREALPELHEKYLKAARVLREADPADPLPYRILRRIVWEDVWEAPPASDGQVDFAGGDEGFARQVEEQLKNEEFAAVVPEAEGRIPDDKLWLDLNFFVVRAMEGLGGKYKAARKAVGDEVAALVRRVPGLLDLRFGDGTPMAGEETRLWILGELQALPQQGGPPGSALVEGVLQEARKLVARKKLAQGVAMVQGELQKLTDRRDRFIGRLQLAKLCQEAGKRDLAQPQLDALDEEAKRFGIEEWEPALAVELARELWKCHKAAGSEKAGEYYARLSRLDLSAALAVDGKK